MWVLAVKSMASQLQSVEPQWLDIEQGPMEVHIDLLKKKKLDR